jgi:predicted flap endonuclease-1-like 5' DNA nuclease
MTFLFVALASLAVGAFAGWLLHARMESPSPDDPETELRALRDAHAGCAGKIRNLHLELAQLEAKLSMSRVDTSDMSLTPVVSEAELAGAARLASLIDVLESGAESAEAEVEHHEEEPAAFMSILPADIVESQAVREPEQMAEPAMVIDLAPQDPVIELDTPAVDDLTLIKGIGPKIAAMLNERGITSFRQIAELDERQIEELGEALGSFRGRIVRDDWVGAARALSSVASSSP